MSTFEQPTEVSCYLANSSKDPLVPGKITRRACTANDVVIDIKFAGICHSDIHTAREEWKSFWGPVPYPLVPGHEIAGIVLKVGANVTKFQVGQKVGVGCMVDSCRNCSSCRSGEEQYCQFGMVGTYNSKFKYPHCAEYNQNGGELTYGGYSKLIVVDHNYVLSVPDNLPFETVAPLLCAGITTYSPLAHFNLRPGQKLAVAGLGGLGHMGVKFGVAFGAHTTVISRGTAKKESALKELKADAYLDSTDKEAVKAAFGTFDFILDTIAAVHDIGLFVNLLSRDGKVVLVGVPEEPFSLYGSSLVPGRKSLSASLIGGIKETQEMLDFCGRKNVTCDVEVIQPNYINEAYERTVKGDVKYRFVIDTSAL